MLDHLLQAFPFVVSDADDFCASYGEFVFDSLGLRRELVEEVLKIREMAMPVID